MSTSFDIARLRLHGIPSGGAMPVRSAVPRHRQGDYFLKGPIPWAWLSAAMALPGKALHVGLNLWLLAGMCKSATVSLSLSSCERFGVSRYAARRGLKKLMQAGLVAAELTRGRKARVTILDATILVSDQEVRP